MWLFLLLSLPLSTVVVFLITKTKVAKHEDKQRQPPGPPKLPIIGNLHQLGSLPHRSLWKLSKKYGPVMSLQFGGVPGIVISSAEAAKVVLKTHDIECCSRPSLASQRRLSYNNLDVSFSPYGVHWREMRKLCVLKLFSLKVMQSFRFVREEEVGSLVESLRRSSLCSSPVNVSEKMYALTASMVFRIAFGKTFGGSGLDDNRFREILHRAQSLFGSFAASDLFPYVGWIVDRLIGFHAKVERSFWELDDFYEGVINEHLDRMTMSEEHEDIVDLLLRIEREPSEYGHEAQFTRDCTKAILMDVFMAGVDTSAITLTWAMAELVKNPIVMKKAQDEVRNCSRKGKLFDENDIQKLKYLKMVVKETMRLHPAATLLLPRETISQFNLDGYEINPKTLLQVNVWAIGRDPKYWDNPDEFFPERFADWSIDYKGQHYEFLPFGAGRRGCPGMDMGMVMVELSLANLLCCFDWKLPDGMNETDIDMEEGFGLTTYKKSALELVPVIYQLPDQKLSQTDY